MAEPVDFSSFSKEEEKAFIPFERAMLSNTRKALNAAGIVAGVLSLIGIAIYFMYTPCSNYCERPPASCKTDSEIAKFKATCADSCRTLEKTAGLRIAREHKDANNKNVMSNDEVSGTEVVQTLAACAFAGSSGGSCEAVTKLAMERGLWCAEKD